MLFDWDFVTALISRRRTFVRIVRLIHSSESVRVNEPVYQTGSLLWIQLVYVEIAVLYYAIKIQIHNSSVMLRVIPIIVICALRIGSTELLKRFSSKDRFFGELESETIHTWVSQLTSWARGLSMDIDEDLGM